MTAEPFAISRPQEGAGRRSRGLQCLGRATDRWPLPARKLADDYAQFAQTCQHCASSIVDACGPKSPDSHRVVWGLTSRPPVLPGGLSSGFPFARRVLPHRPPSSGFPSSGVLRFGPFGRCPVPVPFRFPSGVPFPSAIFTLALPRGGSGGVGPGRQGPRSPVLPRPPPAPVVLITTAAILSGALLTMYGSVNDRMRAMDRRRTAVESPRVSFGRCWPAAMMAVFQCAVRGHHA